MYQELAGLDKSEQGLTKVIDLISILSDKDPEEIKQIDASDLDVILEAIKWTSDSPSSEHKTEIVINETTYYLQRLSSMTLGQQVDLETNATNIEALHKFFAILYQPSDELYTIDAMLKRAELFAEKVMINDVYGAMVFFLNIAKKYESIIQACSMEEESLTK
jgi:hypothetical protein